jgi:transcriptional regulator with XRE-family HTH domain
MRSPVDALYRDFGRRLRAARDGAGLSQAELAERVGLGRTSVTNIETGRQRVPLHLLFDFAGALGVDPATLLPYPPAGDGTIPPGAAKAIQSLGEDEGEWVRRVLRPQTTPEEQRDEG